MLSRNVHQRQIREVRHQIIEGGPEFRFDRVGAAIPGVPDDPEFKAGVRGPLAPGTSDGPAVRDGHRDMERESASVLPPESDAQFFDQPGAPWELVWRDRHTGRRDEPARIGA